MRIKIMSDKFGYERPMLLDFDSISASGIDSCYIDCTSDYLCQDDDEI